MNPDEIVASGLWAQWLGLGVAVVVCATGIYFAMQSRRASQTTTIDLPPADVVSSLPTTSAISSIHWSISPDGGESYLLLNNCQDIAYDVTVEGLTEIDRTRLTVRNPTPSLEPFTALKFGLVSRLSISGPANLIVKHSTEPGGTRIGNVVAVQAP